MFDVFDILVPSLAESSPLELRRGETAFGPADIVTAFYLGMYLAEVRSAREAYSDVAAWTGAADRADWTVLLLAPAANDAARNDDNWKRFLEGVQLTLRAQDTWGVTCESDCDQHPLQKLGRSVDELVRTLDDMRARNALPIAIRIPAA